MSIIELDGTQHHIGCKNKQFSIQSISKVFSFTLALKLYSKKLYNRFGHQPSGNPFNSLVQLEHEKGNPRNPFINAGAIVTIDALYSKYEEETFSNILNFIRKSFGNIRNPIKKVIENYFKQCSIKPIFALFNF